MRLLVACSICLIYVLTTNQLVAYASSDQISVNELLIEIVDRDIKVDCKVKYAVDDRVKVALNNGIEMLFSVDFELQLERQNWLDTKISSLAREFRLKYHALSKQYVLINVEKDYERSFPNLNSAFSYMGRLDDIALASIDVLELDQQYYVRARARLVSESLPLPLRIKSYFSPAWRPSSGWTIWPM